MSLNHSGHLDHSGNLPISLTKFVQEREEKIYKLIDEIYFIATFKPNKKPCFETKEADCSSIVSSAFKFYYGEDHNQTFYKLKEILRLLEKYLEELDPVEELFSSLYFAAEESKQGFENIYITYHYSGFKELKEKLEKLLLKHKNDK